MTAAMGHDDDSLVEQLGGVHVGNHARTDRVCGEDRCHAGGDKTRPDDADGG
jgi:hypothetical protein